MAQDLIDIDSARRLVLDGLERLGPETVQLTQALGRVLAADVRAVADAPPFDSSAMDGYAVAAGPAGRTLTLVGEARAGSPWAGPLGAHEAVRISTGAPVPSSAEAVIRQEDVSLDGERVLTSAEVIPGQNVRRAGEDMRRGAAVLAAGTRIGAVELGAAAAAGGAALAVARRPRVAVLCTGDELREPGEPLGPGQIHNSNTPMLAALAAASGAEVVATRRVGDDRRRTGAEIGELLDRCDVLVICGGVSVGPHDHVKPALAAQGVSQRFWGVSLQPGKPTWFGVRDARMAFALPGNPVSAAVTFTLFVRPALAALQGSSDPIGSLGTAALATAVARNPQREQAVRVRLEHRAEATLAHLTGPQGSHLVTSLLDADGLARIPAGEGSLPAGSEVKLELPPR